MAERAIYRQTFDEDVSTNTQSQCPECDGHLRTHSRETVCEDCGLVVDEERIDRGPDWRMTTDDETSSKRVGSPLTVARHDRGLSGVIGRWTDGNGNTLGGTKRRQLSRLRRQQKRSNFQSKADRNLAHGLGEIRRMTGALDFSTSVRDQACQLFRTAQNEDLLIGRSIEAVAAGCLYGVIRCNGLVRTVDEVATVARVPRDRVEHGYKTVNRELGLPTPPIQPSQHVSRFASKLHLTDCVRMEAEEIAHKAEDAGVTSGVCPTGFAAACLYAAAGANKRLVTQADVAEVADVSKVTVRSHWRTLSQCGIMGEN